MAVTNLDARGRNSRRRTGVIGAIAAVLVSVFVIGIVDGPSAPSPDGVSGGSLEPIRLVVFPFYYLAASGFLQARTGTCVARARRGEREEAGCAIRIDDAETVRELRAVAQRIQIQALIVAAAATIVVLLLPV